jgi:Asp-tRNA(Asn)/Glu-tRNA(Gln) amidotransferase A subunit family amidase
MIELSATAAVEAMRSGAMKAEDYALALLDRAEELDSLNAFRILNREMVLEAARAADKARASGAKLGILHGLPIPVKDSVNTKALPTSQGTRSLRDFQPKNDAELLERLFAQGAILMGKTNLHKFDQIGALARTVADLSLFDMALTGDHRPETATSLKDVRIGISPEYFWSGLDPEVERLSNEALRKLSEAGATLVRAELPEPATAAMEIALSILSYDLLPSISAFLEEQETGINFEQMLEQVSEDLRSGMKRFALPPNRPSEERYKSVLARREDLRQCIRHHFESLGIVALAFPPIMIVPPKIGEEAEVNIRGQKVPLYVAISRNIALGSCASMASLVLPAGVTSDGLPVGMEFDALMGNDRQLLSVGVLLEKALGPIPGPTLSY